MKELDDENVSQLHAIRRRVRLESGRADGRCGKVAEAVASAFGWTYCWGHLWLLDGDICWIHCWNQLADGTIVDATADQFEERWLGNMVVLSPGDSLYTHYRLAPPAHRFHVVQCDGRCQLLARRVAADGAFESAEIELATEPDTPQSWINLGSRAIEFHSGWQLPIWLGREAGLRLQKAAAAGQTLSSRELEFALDAVALQRRSARHGEWTSPEWRESRLV